jgi:hypothetical protein
MPEVVNWLWASVYEAVPLARRWILLGTPVLAHPTSATVFAFAAGASYGLRLPPETRRAAISAGARSSGFIQGTVVDLSDLGEDWLIGMGSEDKIEWWRSAFDHSV